MPCLSSTISSQLPLIMPPPFYKVILHTTGGICSRSGTRIIRQSSTTTHPVQHLYGHSFTWHQEAPCPCCQHSPGCTPAGPCFQQAAGTSENTSCLRRGGTGSHVQPEEQEGPAWVPGWVIRELLLAAPRERGVNTVCPAPTAHQSHMALPLV